MNGTGDGKTESNSGVIKMVVFALAVDAFCGVAALAYCLITGTKADPTLLTSFVGLTGTLLGYLGGILSRTTPTSSTPVETKPSLPAKEPAGSIQVPAQELETTKTT